MDAAVAELFVVHARLFGPLTRQLLDARQVFALALALEDAGLEQLGGLGIPVQEVVQFPLQEIVHKAFQRGLSRSHFSGSELGFSLRLKNRLLHFDRNRRGDASADVRCIVILSEEIPDNANVSLTEGGLVGTALRRVLAVDKTLVVLPVGICMRDGHFNIFIDKVNNGITRIFVQVVGQQVFQAVFRLELLAVQIQGEGGVQVGVVPQQPLDVFHAVAVRLEYVPIGPEGNHGTVALFGFTALLVVHEVTALELCPLDFTLPVALHGEIRRQGVHGFGPHPVQAH